MAKNAAREEPPRTRTIDGRSRREEDETFDRSEGATIEAERIIPARRPGLPAGERAHSSDLFFATRRRTGRASPRRAIRRRTKRPPRAPDLSPPPLKKRFIDLTRPVTSRSRPKFILALGKLPPSTSSESPKRFFEWPSGRFRGFITRRIASRTFPPRLEARTLSYFEGSFARRGAEGGAHANAPPHAARRAHAHASRGRARSRARGALRARGRGGRRSGRGSGGPDALRRGIRAEARRGERVVASRRGATARRASGGAMAAEIEERYARGPRGFPPSSRARTRSRRRSRPG